MTLVNDELYNAVDDGVKDYYYFIKLIPTVFVDETLGEFTAYSYSLNHNDKPSNIPNLPMIVVIYDFAPINMKIVKERKDFGKFLVQLCAIIGGVFVVFGLVNRLFLRLKNSVVSED